MQEYKGYWISANPRFLMRGDDGWQSCGSVCQVAPSMLTTEIVRFECVLTFADQVAAKNHGLDVAKKWVVEKGESFKLGGRRGIGQTPCPCESKDQETLNLTRR